MRANLPELWKDVEERYAQAWRIAFQKDSPKPFKPISADFPWNELYQDVIAMKRQIERQQILARLSPQPTFLNCSDRTWEEDEKQKRLARMASCVAFRFPALLWHASTYGCLDTLDIISNSTITEWPLDLGGQGQFWDRAPLYFQVRRPNSDRKGKRGAQKKKSSKTSVDGELNEDVDEDPSQEVKVVGHTYQIRFLALENYPTSSPAYAEVHHSLRIKKGPLVVGEVQDSLREPDKSYGQKRLSEDEPFQKTILRADNTAKFRLCIPLNNAMFVVGTGQTMGQATNFTIESQVLVCCEWGMLFMSNEKTLQHFDLYAEYSRLFSQEALQKVRSYYTSSIFSHSFFLQSNAAKQEYDHYFPAAWRVIHEYYKYPEAIQEHELENAKLTLEQTLTWLKGIVPSMCTRKCRVLDEKEVRYVCRLLLIKKICRAAGYEVTESKHPNKASEKQKALKKIDRKKEWVKKKDEAIELEQQIFGGRIISEEDRRSSRQWIHAMVKALFSWKNRFPDSLPIEQKDLKDRRHIVVKYWEKPVPEEMEIRPADSSIIIWLMHVGKAVEDVNENLCPRDGSTSLPTIELWNRRLITLRSPERCRQNVVEFSNQAVLPAIVLSFDAGHLDHLLIHFTRFNNNPEVHFGRVPISLIGQLRKWAKIGENQTEEVRGLRAFFCQGYPSNFRHILQSCAPHNVDTITTGFIYGSDAKATDSAEMKSKAIFMSRPELIQEMNEIDPLFGKPRILEFTSPQQLFIQEPEFSKLTISESNKSPQDLPRKLKANETPKTEVVEGTSQAQTFPVTQNPQMHSGAYAAGQAYHTPSPVQQYHGHGYSPVNQPAYQQFPYINYPPNQYDNGFSYEWTTVFPPPYSGGYLQPSPLPQAYHSNQSSGEISDPHMRNGHLQSYPSPPNSHTSPRGFDPTTIPGNLSPHNPS